MSINSKLKLIASIFITLLFFVSSAHARWWIFGKAKGKPEVTKLFVGEIDTQHIEGTIYLFKNHLKEGRLEIKGFYRPASGAQVIQARVSLNGGETWEENVNLESNSFYFSIKPEPMQTYRVRVSLMDTKGQENDPGDIPRISFIYQETTAEAVAEEALKELSRQYSQRNYKGFTNLISEEYRGDKMSLEDAVAKDFLNYRQINLSVIPSRTLIENLDARIDFRYDVSATKASDGSVTTLNGQTSYTLRMERNTYKLLQMMPPIIFGTSARSDENPTGEGDHDVKDKDQSLGGGHAPGVTEGSGYVKSPNQADSGFDFETGKNGLQESSDIVALFIAGFHPNDFQATSPAGAQDLGAVSLNSIKTAPSTGYFVDVIAVAGHSYAVKTRNGFYALLQVKSVDATNKIITFDTLYQSNGSRLFSN